MICFEKDISIGVASISEPRLVHPRHTKTSAFNERESKCSVKEMFPKSFYVEAINTSI